MRSDTGAPSYEQRAADNARLVAWAVFVGLLAVLAYAQRADSGSPDRDVLYRYSTAAGTLVVYAVMLFITCAIAGFRRDLLALRRPVSWPAALGFGLAIILVVYTAVAVLEPVLHGGREQGLTPKGWEPNHAGAYLVNAVVIAGVVPFVEELLFRGVGFSLVSRFGRWVAIVVVGVAFGLAHGLVGGFVQIALFGCALAWLRARSDSAVPGMFIHSAFNGLALLAAVTVGN